MTVSTIFIIHLVLATAIIIRIIMRKATYSVTLAWIVTILVLPYGGALAYLLVGEKRISTQRIRLVARRHQAFLDITKPHLEKTSLLRNGEGLVHVDHGLQAVGSRFFHTPAVLGNSISLFGEPLDILQRIALDIENAKATVLMEFYIWHQGGLTGAVLDALTQAARRGIRCYVLIDAVGASDWWKTDQPNQLQAAGVVLKSALPTGVRSSIAGRFDLRMHRKIVVIDGAIAWTGSMNMVDPRHFLQEMGIGQWKDAMIRIQGPAAGLLSAVVISDLLAETAEADDVLSQQAFDFSFATSGLSAGLTPVQVLPSGPGETGDALLQVILSLINRSRQEIVITTPYFIPEEALVLALRGAAARGVRVAIILPKKIDSAFAQYASRSHFDHLLDAGVEIHEFNGGVLHIKSIAVDGDVALFGTANFDMRSLWLNFEISLLIYDQDFVSRLRALQDTYLYDSVLLNLTEYSKRSFNIRFAEGIMRLASPLL